MGSPAAGGSDAIIWFCWFIIEKAGRVMVSEYTFIQRNSNQWPLVALYNIAFHTPETANLSGAVGLYILLKDSLDRSSRN